MTVYNLTHVYYRNLVMHYQEIAGECALSNCLLYLYVLATNMSGQIKLTYFDARGRAELARLLLKLAGKDFEDNRVDGEGWQKFKPSKFCYEKNCDC